MPERPILSSWSNVTFLIVLVAACSVGAGGTSNNDTTKVAAPPEGPSGMATGRVTWIDDGDTIEVDSDSGELTLRLIGINAPERGECYADRGLDFLIDEVKGRSVQYAELGIDQFGRVLADVWLENRWINGELVASGMATAVTPDETHPLGRHLVENEESAFANGIGLWGEAACGDGGQLPAVDFDITQSNFNPPGPDDSVLDDEYVTIANLGSEEVDMSGWVLRDESSRNRLIFDDGTTLAGRESLTISSGCSTRPSWCGGRSIWNNAGDLALLLDEDGRVVARLRY